MAESSTTYHEALEKLSSTTQDMHRALVSLQEELEAVDWYQQRAEACTDEALQAILLHNMREEIEHAAMVIEWLRRHSADFDRHLRTYLFQDRPLGDIEAQDAPPVATPRPTSGHRPTLTIGTLKGE
jgi:ferritin-like protein